MNFLFDSVDWTKKYTTTFILTKKNKKPICFLNEAQDRNLEVNLDVLSQLSFTIPYYIEDPDSHQQIKNPNYDKVVEENMILVKCEDMANPSYEAYFIIKTITENTDKLSKKVECKSRETLLNKNILTLDGVERQLTKTSSPDVSDGVFDFLASETTWSLGHVDALAQFESVNGGTNPKYRWFDSFSKPWLQFLHDDVQSAYDVVLIYDTVNKKINVYDRKTYGTHTGIILSEENYIKNLNKKISAENIVTKLDCTGRDNTTFEGVNPLGATYILNYDYFRSNGQMSDELSEALDKYDVLINQKNAEFQALKSQVDDLNGRIIVKQSQLSTLNEQLKALNYLRQGYIESSDNDHLPQATTNVNNKMSEIGLKQNEITALQNQITSIQGQMTAVSSAIDKNNARDTYGNLIFNADLLEELEDFTYTESWNNNYYATADSLLTAAKDVLKDWSVPPIEFNMDLADFFAVVEQQKYWGKIKIGDLVRVYSSKLNTNTDVRIVAYSYNIDSNSLKITFSNKDKKLDDTRNIGSTIKKANDSAKVLNVKKITWDSIKNTSNAVESFLNNNLDVSRQQVISQLGKNKINITENGIFVINADDENQQIAILSGLVAITQDGWQSCGTAINSTGIFSKYLVGQILLGEQLYIADALGIVTIESGTIKIKDANGNLKVVLGNYATGKYGLQIVGANGQVILDETGLLQTLPYTKEENCDNVEGIEFLVYVPEKASEIRSVKLSFKLLPFRAYETATAASSTLTSSNGGSSTVTSALNATVAVSQMDQAYTGDVNYTGVPGDITSHNHPHAHTHTILGHSHDVTTPNHTHTVPTHIHNMAFGIYKSTNATGVNIYVDGVLKDNSGYTTDQTGLELSQYITTNGWHNIKLTSSQLGRINATIIIEAFCLS